MAKVSYPVSIVLKDYWVCQLLGALHEEFPGTFLLKGGTSLAKGWGLIDRMSEDVDILVSEAVDESNDAKERRLLEMTRSAAERLGLDWRVRRQPGRAPDAHRDDLFLYDPLGFEAVGVDLNGVLLQSGFGQGWEPHELIDVRPILASVTDGAETFDDLGAIRVLALRPVRTLI
jgi:hypothetical protein